MGGDDDARRGTRLDHEHGLGAGGLEGEHAAARLHDQQLSLEPRIAQAGLDAGEVALNDGPHAGVDEGGAGAEILAELRRHLRGERDRRFREDLVHDLARAPLMFGIAVGVEIAHAKRLHAFLPERLRRPGNRLLVQRRHHRSGCVETFRDAETQVPGRQRPRLLEQQVVEGGPDLALDLQHVPEPFCGDEAGGRELPLDDGVGGHRGPVHEISHIRRPDARLAQDALHRGEKADRRVPGGGGDFHDPGPARVLVYEDSVGEGAANVNSQPVAMGHAVARPGWRQRAVSASSTVQEPVSTATL